MRWFFSALMTIGIIAALDAAPAAARDYPFCIKGDDFNDGTMGDCSFSTYAQCQASASGRAASCDANPYYNANAQPQPGHVSPSQRRH